HGHLIAHVKSGSGAVVGLAAVGGLAAVTGLPLLMAPFGATAVLLFGQPASPLSQPINVFGGYLVAASFGAGAALLLPAVWWASAIAVGQAGPDAQPARDPPAGRRDSPDRHRIAATADAAVRCRAARQCQPGR